jgi:hypothetical protein
MVYKKMKRERCFAQNDGGDHLKSGMPFMKKTESNTENLVIYGKIG